MLKITHLVLSPAFTNAYLIADSDTGEAAVIDPAWDGHLILAEAEKLGWNIRQLWVTHAHFDHIGGVGAIVEGLDPPPRVALHPADLPLWRAQGGAPFFGLRLTPAPDPDVELSPGQVLRLGSYQFEVRHAPGHSLGHVIFYCAAESVLFSGDVIFQSGIGRTDLPGGDFDTLMESIREQVMSLPDETRILSGHGPETSVGQERRENPWVGWGA
ncbi:MAG: MBL fold metallo-hydrolase [Chloroflexota bacterium]